ncbi:MAG: hypothetical protein AABZ47_04715, partial [Planctomycetota bacterium]
GRPFSQLAEFIETALPGVDGGAVERSINRAAEKRAVITETQVDLSPSSPAACGALGMGGVFGLFMAPAMLFLSQSTWGRHRK